MTGGDDPLADAVDPTTTFLDPDLWERDGGLALPVDPIGLPVDPWAREVVIKALMRPGVPTGGSYHPRPLLSRDMLQRHPRLPHRCDCGCGELVTQPATGRTKRYLSRAHAKRARRRWGPRPDRATGDVQLPDAEAPQCAGCGHPLFWGEGVYCRLCLEKVG